MTGSAPGDVVHQVVVSTSPTSGAAVLASSLGSQAEEGFWLAVLRDRAPLPEAPGLYRPDHAMTFVQLRNGGSALLWRSAEKAHALVGRGRMLNTDNALCLDSWPGWRARRALKPVPEATLQRDADRGSGDLLGRVERVQASLVSILASLLGSWTAPVTIVGCPDEDRVAIVWALREIGRRARERRAMRQWAFSTYELTDADPVGALPFEIVFLAAHPGESSGRQVVDLTPYSRHRTLSEDPIARRRAYSLVDGLVGGISILPGLPIDLGHEEAVPDEAPPTVERKQPTDRAAPSDTGFLPLARAAEHYPSPPSGPVPTLRCPTCADQIRWIDDGWVSVWDEAETRYERMNVGGMEPRKRADLLRRAYRRCPNPSRDTPEHYLPATYADYKDPLVIGLVGLTSSGKTHLLTAMIRDAYRGGLLPFGVQTTSLDRQRHASFRLNYVERFDEGDVLPGTGSEVVDAADILLLRGPAGTRPITFFDVAGETLADQDVKRRAARFLLAVNAVIFVHGPEDLRDGRARETGENAAFDLAMERIDAANGGDVSIPAAIAVTKSDRLRFVPPIDRWLRRGTELDLDARRIRAESRDAFAYLHNAGATSVLGPFWAFPRCTLHFVSASGGDATGQGASHRFHRGVRPVRVLEPLISILAMTGVLVGPEAEQVGVP